MRITVKNYEYTCKTKHYQYSCIVRSTSIKQARMQGVREAQLVMGNHARIIRDEVRELR